MKKNISFYFTLVIFFLFCTFLYAENIIKVTDYDKGFLDWKVKAFSKKATFTVEKKEKKSIHLESKENSYSVAKELYFNLAQYPYLNFEWKVTLLPEKGDLRNKNTDDQAAQIYVIIPSFPEMVNFKAIGYVWDSNAPTGVYQSKKSSNIKYVVLKSGKGGIGKWYTEKVNVYEDFKKLWNMDVKNKKVVVSIGIDSDDTKSAAESYFGEIYFSQR